jgi:signal transduction histidine kinase
MPTASPAAQARIERVLREFPSLVAELDLNAVLQRVADLAAEIVGAQYVAVGLLGPDGKSLESFITSGLTQDQRSAIGALPVGRGILGLLIQEGRPIRLRDLGQHPASAGFPPDHPAMKTFLGVPITGRQGVLGEVYLTEKLGGGEFNDEDEHIAVLLSIATASAVENARLHGDRTRLLEEVQLLHRSRERFFAMVNHELRNALAAVYGWSEMLVRKKDPATVPRAAYEIVDSAEQAISLINDLLDLSRLDEDRLKPVLRNVECGRILRTALHRVTPQAAERRISLELDAPAQGILTLTDAHRVEQILVNILRNAIRHSPSDEKVETSVGREDGTVVFRIADRGPGIPPDQTERIFDVYFTSVGEERMGNGLGLPLSRRLARLLGGDLVAQSRPDAGAVFILRLPGGDPET